MAATPEPPAAPVSPGPLHLPELLHRRMRIGDTVLLRAIHCIDRIETHNDADLVQLYAQLPSDYAVRRAAAITRLRLDLARVRVAVDALSLRPIEAACARLPPRDRVALIYGLQRLGGGNDTPGLLEAARQLLESTAQLTDLDPARARPRHREISFYKLALLYLGGSLRPAAHHLTASACELAYPVQLPLASPLATVLRPLLLVDKVADALRLWLPNAGFMPGGEMVDGRCRGIDSPALIAHSVDCPTRLTPRRLVRISRYLQGGQQPPLDAALVAVAQRLRPIAAVPAALQRGDLIFWCADDDDHVAMFDCWLQRHLQRFLGIDASCRPGEGNDDVGYDCFALRRAGARTFVLRPT